jgi:hypothetical protein
MICAGSDASSRGLGSGFLCISHSDRVIEEYRTTDRLRLRNNVIFIASKIVCW